MVSDVLDGFDLGSMTLCDDFDFQRLMCVDGYDLQPLTLCDYYDERH